MKKMGKRTDVMKNSRIQSENILGLLKKTLGQPLRNFPIPPFTKWLNGTIQEVRRGFVEILYNTRKEMANPTNILHGGAHSAMIDDSIGIACATLGYKNFLLTIDLRMDFLGRIPIGQPVTIRAEVIREGSSIVHAEARTYLSDGSLVAIAQSNLLRVSEKPNYQKSPQYDNLKRKNP